MIDYDRLIWIYLNDPILCNIQIHPNMPKIHPRVWLCSSTWGSIWHGRKVRIWWRKDRGKYDQQPLRCSSPSTFRGFCVKWKTQVSPIMQQHFKKFDHSAICTFTIMFTGICQCLFCSNGTKLTRHPADLQWLSWPNLVVTASFRCPKGTKRNNMSWYLSAFQGGVRGVQLDLFLDIECTKLKPPKKKLPPWATLW